MIFLQRFDEGKHPSAGCQENGLKREKSRIPTTRALLALAGR